MCKINTIIQGDVLRVLKALPDNYVNCCVTSPPYWGLRDYGHTWQIGLEKTPEFYTAKMVEVFTEVKRVLKPDGTLWLNLGDSYAGSGKGAATHPGTNENWKQGTNKGTHNKTIHTFKSNNYKPKDLIGIPWMVAFALRAAGWYLRSDVIEEVELYCPCGCGYKLEERIWRYAQDRDIIWKKPNPMPESVTDRPTKSHEYIFLMSKSAKYYYDYEAIQEKSVYDVDGDGTIKRQLRQNEGCKSNPTKNKNGIRQVFPNGKNAGGVTPQKTVNGVRNKRSVWTVTTKPYKEAHFATFPEQLIVDCIKAGCPENGIVLDPFMGAGTTAIVARKLNRNFIGIELNQKYIDIANKRIERELGLIFHK